MLSPLDAPDVPGMHACQPLPPLISASQVAAPVLGPEAMHAHTAIPLAPCAWQARRTSAASPPLAEAPCRTQQTGAHFQMHLTRGGLSCEDLLALPRRHALPRRQACPGRVGQGQLQGALDAPAHGLAPRY
jgi:hypothetical protein